MKEKLEAIYQYGQGVTQAELVSTLTVNKCLQLSPDLLRLSNVELGAVTSNLLVSLLQHSGWGAEGGGGLVITGLQTGMELS